MIIVRAIAFRMIFLFKFSLYDNVCILDNQFGNFVIASL